MRSDLDSFASEWRENNARDPSNWPLVMEGEWLEHFICHTEASIAPKVA